MAETPENVVLTPSQPSAPAEAVVNKPASEDTDYPKALYHKDKSKPGALVSKLVTTAAEEKEAGNDWVPHSALKLEAE